MRTIVAVGFASVYTEFIFLDLYCTSVFFFFYLKISYLAMGIKLCWLRMAMDNHSGPYKLISMICSLDILHLYIFKIGCNPCATRAEEFRVKLRIHGQPLTLAHGKSFWRREEMEGGQSGGPAGLNLTVWRRNKVTQD